MKRGNLNGPQKGPVWSEWKCLFLRFPKKKKKNIPPVLNGQYQADEIPSKIKRKIYAALYCISNFAGTSYKKLRDTATSPFISSCFTSVENFIHHYQKKDFWYYFSFFNGFTPTLRSPQPTPLTAKIHKVW